MTKTTNFGLKKPEENDFYDFETQNENLDVIDEKLKECMEGGTAEKVTYENESVEDVTNVKEALDGIFDGTQQVGDSAKLGGKDAELYALLTDLANYLPLDGSKPITGNMFKIANGYGAVSASEGHVAMCSFLDSNSTSTGDVLVMFNSLRGNRGIFYRQQVNDVPTDYALLHAGNKPSGTYTGNGSANRRYIETGGIGDFIVIQGNGYITTISGMSGSGGNSTSYKGFASGEVYFANGTCELNTAHEALNANGVTYTYRVY